MRWWLGVLLSVLLGCEAPAHRPFEPATDLLPGVVVRELTRAQLRDAGLDYGLVVVRVAPPADRSLIRPGDVVVAVDTKRVRNVEEFKNLVAAANGPISLAVRRGPLDFVVALERGVRGPARGTLLRT
jgi:S1-C subfamily serine protease